MKNLLQVSALQTHYLVKGAALKAVDGVSFSIERGETLAIVGESGCGKSTLALSVFRLVSPPGYINAGEILFNGQDLMALPEKQLGNIRGREMGLILQDSLSALNPLMRVGSQIAEARRHHFSESRKDAKRKALEIMERVQLPEVEKTYKSYPHQLSGGQRQRIAIAIALACEPKILVADEPTTALDVSIQGQVLALLKTLQQEMQLGLLLITHDLGIVAQMADKMAVMYAGKIIEQGRTGDVFGQPAHPYTTALLASIPRIEIGETFAPSPLPEPLPGAVPDLLNLPSGCTFHPRCRERMPACLDYDSREFTIGHKHSVRCLKYDDSRL